MSIFSLAITEGLLRSQGHLFRPDLVGQHRNCFTNPDLEMSVMECFQASKITTGCHINLTGNVSHRIIVGNKYLPCEGFLRSAEKWLKGPQSTGCSTPLCGAARSC